MKRLLINIHTLATMNETDEIISGAYVSIDDNVIEEVGPGEPSDLSPYDEIIDLSGHVVIPGLVNTHHHLYQSLFRNVREVASAKLFDWLTYLYGLWEKLDNEAIYVSTKVAVYEMMKSGVTTTTDMLYLHPKGKERFIDSEIEGAAECGIRFHPTRGSMSLSEKDGGLPPDSVVQTHEQIMEDSRRLIERFHDPRKLSMLRIALAPCSPFSVKESSLAETVELAEEYDVLLHTHLAETRDEEEFCLSNHGLRPVDYMKKVGWLNRRVWFAHVVWVNDSDIRLLSESDCGIAHCPSSNMRLGSGIAPIRKMLDNGLRVGLAVDGSASNDTGNMLLEARNMLLLQRVKEGAEALTPYEALRAATIGGASVLRMDDYTGSIDPGKAADLIAFNLNRIEFAGGVSEPVGSLIMCDAKQADFVMINGKVRIKEGQFLDKGIDDLVKRHNEISLRLVKLAS
ncbi:MAG TPA: 8-oxoguanine deaminase [Kosmotogaceae bacterium]|nr:MAG: Amidohydrolase [Thermotogales bacterium 46_20]HAA85602.1 8-oxoguanine deaminase [Kosmotogaceae bacterium]